MDTSFLASPLPPLEAIHGKAFPHGGYVTRVDNAVDQRARARVFDSLPLSLSLLFVFPLVETLFK